MRQERHRRILWRVRQLVASCTVQTRRVRLPFPHTFASGSDTIAFRITTPFDLDRKLVDLEKGSHRVAVWTLPPPRHRRPPSTQHPRVRPFAKSEHPTILPAAPQSLNPKKQTSTITSSIRLGCIANLNCPPSTQAPDHRLRISQIWIPARSLQ